jgi:hypothetical protein
MTKNDSRVLHAPGMKPEKIRVVRDDDALMLPSEREVLFIRSAKEACLGWRGHVDAAATKRLRDGEVNVLVKMESESHRHPCLRIRCRLMLSLSEVLDEFFVSFHLLLNLVPMDVVIGERGVDVGQRKLRVTRDNFVG